MREQGIQGRRRPKFTRTTDSNHSLPVADDVLGRKFTASKPDKAWLTDNAVAEIFNSTLKTELVLRTICLTRDRSGSKCSTIASKAASL